MESTKSEAVKTCERCGLDHEAECAVDVAAQPAANANVAPGDAGTEQDQAEPAGPMVPDSEGAEACAFCGERHPPRYKCGEWAKLVGTTTETHWGGAGFSKLPERPPLTFRERRDSTRTDRGLLIGGQLLVILLAFVGVFTLMKLAFDRGGSSTSAASLPACTVAHVQANVNHVSTVQAEGNTALPKRVDEINALTLQSGSGCDPDVFQLYSSYIAYSALCVELPKTDACGAAGTTRTSLAQALANAQ